MKTCNRFRPRVEELERRLAPATLSHSTNWSGYAVNTSAGAVSQVSGSWVVPPVSSSVSGYSSAWVGIDGYGSSSVEQIGTDSDYVNGAAHYYAWYEMYPAGSVNLGLSISPGDTINAVVSYTGSNQFTLSITDVNTGASFSTNQISSQAKRSSAEWIQEAPSSVGGVLPLAKFGTISFSGANATINGTNGFADNPWSGTTLYQIDMVTKNGALKATTSALSDAATPAPSSFSVTWDSSGSSGHGGGHHSANRPSLDSQAALLSAAAAGLAANAQRLTPVLVGSSSFSLTSALPAMFAPAASPAFGTSNATVAPLAPEAASPAGPIAKDAAMPELLFSSGSAPQSDQTPAILPDASSEIDQAAD